MVQSPAKILTILFFVEFKLKVWTLSWGPSTWMRIELGKKRLLKYTNNFEFLNSSVTSLFLWQKWDSKPERSQTTFVSNFATITLPTRHFGWLKFGAFNGWNCILKNYSEYIWGSVTKVRKPKSNILGNGWFSSKQLNGIFVKPRIVASQNSNQMFLRGCRVVNRSVRGRFRPQWDGIQALELAHAF